MHFGSMFASIYIIILSLQLIRCSPVEQVSEKDTRPRCPCNTGNPVNTRVVGGHAVGRNSIPYASGLLYHTPGDTERILTSQPYCGGTLITDRHVLTAAHCLKSRTANQVFVDVGVYTLKNMTEGQIVPAMILTKFPEYLPDSFHSDIGIVELKYPVKLNPGVLTAPLPNPNLELKPGTTVYVFGWGRLGYNDGHPDELQAVDLPVVENHLCQKKFVSTIEERMICAGGEVGKDACIGDSGSGLVVRLDNDIVLVGVVSFGRSCALPHVPGVYTKVSSYVDWILENTQSATCRPCIHGEEN